MINSNIDELNEAINVIKDECSKHGDCTDCPLHRSHRPIQCSLINDDTTTPFEWQTIGDYDD